MTVRLISVVLVIIISFDECKLVCTVQSTEQMDSSFQTSGYFLVFLFDFAFFTAVGSLGISSAISADVSASNLSLSES